MINNCAITTFQSIETPFYYYNMEVLNKTLDLYTSLIHKYDYSAHYALKANANDKILSIIQKAGLGADCVSGNEVELAIKSGFAPNKIVYAGVGKSDKEINIALKAGIFSFNCESIPEIKIINDFAASMGKVAKIALRINPDIDAHTHKYISTGRKEDKFGISPWMFEDVVELIKNCKNVELIGLHFHIGSQILDLNVFKLLCNKVEEIQQWFINKDIFIHNINLGGGLGVDYETPN
ncbi:MAG: diaminopimelate decarboxylase, partial [Bacteroidales bacterium]